MGIQPGTRVGPYEVGAVIGSGGMGDVYRATDTTLDRDVAIKALPPAFATDAGRIARFEQEAKVLAALNHPNIAQIYGLERGGESAVIVMELVDGPTLADRIARGPIPADDALAIALQIIAALEAAHDKGIVHRDLKPANIKLRVDGTVKVLDFGIAKNFDAGPLISGPQSPVMTTPVTQAGVILGTAAYMSPEQARGKPVDQRADIWAFGCVLFEMLTGQPIFAGEDVSITLARVLERDTNLDSMPSAITPAVKHTIALCLRKDPRKRFHSIADVRLALTGDLLAAGASATTEGAGALTGARWRRLLPLAAGIVLGGIIVGAAVEALSGDEVSRPVIRMTTTVEPVRDFFRLAISDGGERIVYTEGTPPRVMVRELAEFAARELPNVDISPGLASSITGMCFSPDGNEIAHFSGNGSELRRSSVTGGGSVLLAPDLGGTGGSCDWGDDGFVYFGGRQLARVAETGGDPVESLLDVVEDEELLVSPQLLPGGKLLAYSIATSNSLIGSVRIGILDLETGDRNVLDSDAGLATFVKAGTSQASGYFVYPSNGALYMAAFDGDRRVLGPQERVVDSIMGFRGLGFFAVSANGTLAYMDGSLSLLPVTPTWVDRAGRTQGTLGAESFWGEVFLPPGNAYVLAGSLEIDTLTADLWQIRLPGGLPAKLGLAGVNGSVVWMPPDGERVLYVNIPELGAAASSLNTRVVASGASTTIAEFDMLAAYPTSISPDGDTLIGSARPFSARGPTDIFVMDLKDVLSSDDPATEDDLEFLLQSEHNEAHASFSPDGHWIAYDSNESGRDEVYVIPYPYPGPGSKIRVSTDGGRQPRWNPAGGELFYLSGARMMSAAVETDGDFDFETPGEVFQSAALIEVNANNPDAFQYEYSPERQEFLILTDGIDTAEQQHLRVILNWTAELGL